MKFLASSILSFLFVLFSFIVIVITVFVLYTEHLDGKITNKKITTFKNEKPWYFEMIDIDSKSHDILHVMMTIQTKLSEHHKKSLYIMSGTSAYKENELSSMVAFYNDQYKNQLNNIERYKLGEDNSVHYDVGRICVMFVLINKEYVKAYMLPNTKENIKMEEVKNVLIEKNNYPHTPQSVEYFLTFFDCNVKNGT